MARAEAGQKIDDLLDEIAELQRMIDTTEALTLTWDNVDLKNGFLTVQDAYAKSGEDPDGSAGFRFK